MKKDAKRSSPPITTNQAAIIIGCSPQQVRTLIRKGKIKAEKKKDVRNPAGYNLEVDKESVKLYAKTIPRQGWPRGVPRNL